MLKTNYQFFINGEGVIAATSADESIAAAEVNEKMTSMDSSEYISNELNPDWELNIIGIAPGTTKVTVVDAQGRTMEITVVVKKVSI